MKKVLLIILAVMAIAMCFVGKMFAPVYQGAKSVTQLDEGVYFLEFTGDDGFDDYLASGGASDSYAMASYIMKFLSHGLVRMPDPEPVEEAFGCSALAVNTAAGERLMGRNFDWGQQSLQLIAKVHPKGGYSYISSFDGNFLGFYEGWKPEKMADRFAALSGIFVALDGINEKGLAIADLTAGDGETHQDAGLPDLTTTCAIKYLLKSAASVDEAVELLKGIDMHSDIGSLHHLAMNDASGNSVVVEYVGEKMVVTPAEIVTNHYLCPENFGYGLLDFDKRYEKLEAVRDSLGGVVVDSDQLLDAMKVAWQSWTDENNVNGGTQWTALFNLSDCSVDYIARRDPSKRFHFCVK